MAKPKTTPVGKAKAKPTPKIRKATQADIIRLGQATADLKASTPPKQWSQIVKNAHARGFTLAGALSGNPDPLKERTASALKSQAQSEVTAAYKPALADNAAQQTRVQAWEAKRSTDNKAYEEWVANETAKLNTQATQADQTIRDAAHAATARTAEQWTAASAQGQANAGAAQGTVSAPAQSTALDFTVNAAQGVQSAANAEQRANDVTGVFAQTRPLMAAGSAAAQAALSAQAKGETQKQMTQLVDERSKINLAAAGDFVKNWAALKDKEVSKASSNRDYQTVVEQLNQAGAKIATGAATDAAKIASDAKTAAAKLKATTTEKAKDRALSLTIAQVNATAKADTLAETTRHNKEMEAAKKLHGPDSSAARLAETTRHNKEMERISKARTSGQSKPGGRDSTTRASDGKIVSNVGRAKVRFSQLRAKRAAGSKLDIIQVMTKDGYDLPTIQIARALLDHHGKLPAQTKKIASALGISDPALLEG